MSETKTTYVEKEEPGSWTPNRAYSDPLEYTYSTYKLLERRVMDEIRDVVLCTVLCSNA